MKKLLAAFAVFALLSAGTVFADEKTVEPAEVACCSPKCEVKDGKCVTHEAKKCAKDCAAPCCKPAPKPEHPKGDHPKGEHPKGRPSEAGPSADSRGAPGPERSRAPARFSSCSRRDR